MPRFLPHLLLALAVPLHAATGIHDAESDYAEMQKWQFAEKATPLTAPVTITRDTATWMLESGEVRLMQPTKSGRVTGFVFEGKGRFTMTIPDRVELAQLRRFTSKPDLQKLDQPFTELVFRASDDEIARLLPVAPSGTTYAPNALAVARHRHWLEDLRDDTDARITAAMLNAGALQITAAIHTPDFDWLTYDYDSSRHEEIQIIRWQRQYPEVWISLDRAGDRAANGRPGAVTPSPARLDNIDVHADLTRRGESVAHVGATGQSLINGRYAVDETLTMRAPGIAALRMELHPAAQKLIVRDAAGHDLVTLRDHIGKRSRIIDNRIYDATMTILLPEPPKPGDSLRLHVEYELETANYAPGNIWYPTVPDSFEDRHTAKLDLQVRNGVEVRAMGKRTAPNVWVVDKPQKMITWVTSEHATEEKVESPGVPTAIAFGSGAQIGAGAKMHNVAADVSDSLQYYQKLFADPVNVPQIYVTSIIAGHGQSFEGFLHLAEETFDEEHPGASELFRAHEVAHQWWGHKVGWASYRDQWLSEAFAEYSAMMFVHDTVKGGDRYFEEILNAYENMLRGSISMAFSKFFHPWVLEMNRNFRGRLGPIDVGYRAGTGDVPTGYLIQTYYKGPLALHMMRILMRGMTKSDDAFFRVLRDFAKEYDGKAASTADFQKIVQRDVPADWSFFFNDWIYGADVPTYTWNWKAEGNNLALTVKRSGVPDDFFMPVVVRVEFAGGKSGTLIVPVKNAEQTFTRALPEKPVNVIFAPDHALALANMRRE